MSHVSRLLLLALLLCVARSAGAQTGTAATTPVAEPVSGVIVVDASTSADSLSGADGKRFREAFARFAQASGGRDEFTVVEVSTYASVSLDRTEDAAEVSKKLSRLFSSREPAATSLFDGCALALKKAAQGKYERRFILVLSDGVDTVSELSLKEVEKLLKEGGVKLFAIEVESRDRVGNFDGGFRALEALAKASGGAAYRQKKKGEFDPILSSIREALRR
ncbi:MAG TPA: VWA domain-containing protein [Pyrinomonadaceae bacterium]